MASYTASQAKTVTTVGSQVDDITLTGEGSILRFITTSGSTHTYFTAVPNSDTPATPTVGGDNCYAVAHGNVITDYPWPGTSAKLKIVNSGVVTLTVMLVP